MIDQIVGIIELQTEKLRGRNLTIEEYEKLSKATNELFYQIKVGNWGKDRENELDESQGTIVKWDAEIVGSWNNFLGDLTYLEKNKIPEYSTFITLDIPKDPVCECGKEKHNFMRHMEFCPKFQ